MKYHDKLQAKLEATALKTILSNISQEQLIGLLMLEENLFYDEAKERWQQAVNSLKKG